MKLTYFKTAARIILLQLALLLGQCAQAAVNFTLAPNSVSNSYAGTIQLQVTGLPTGASVVVQKFLDINANGVVDPTDLLVQQFTLTDGQAGMVIGGVTNFDVPGDTDSTAGQITANLRFFNGDFSQNVVGQYIYVIAGITKTSQVTSVAYPQSITGTVTNTSGAPVPDAVILLFPPPRGGGHNGPGNPTGGTVANASGVYTIQAPVGSYSPMAFSSNFVTDTQTAATVTLPTNSTITNNLALVPATRTISATLFDAVSNSIVLPGVFEPVSDNGVIAIGFSDTNGLLTLRVTSGTNWGIGTDDKGLTLHGYVGYENGTNIDTSGGDATGRQFPLYKATALIYGTVLDALSNALVGVDVSDNDSFQTFSQDAYTDASGKYVLGVVGNVATNDTWTVQAGNGETFTNYIFSQPDFDTNGGTNINAGQALLGNIIGLIPTNFITGNVSFNGSNVVGVGVTAYATVNGVSFNLNTSDTGSNGNYSLAAGNGNWNVFVFCQGYQGGNGSDNLDAIIGTNLYQCPNNTNVVIANSNAVANFFVQGYSTFLSGLVQDDHGTPVTNMNIFAFPTNGGGNYQATTDNGGNFIMGIAGGGYTLALNNDTNSGFPALNLVGPSIPITVTDGINISNILLVAPRVTGAIQVQVNGQSNSGVPGIGAFANLTNGITNYVTYGSEVPTGTNGAVSLPVFNGSWQVSLDNNNVQNAGYNPVNSQTAVITNSTNTVTFNLTLLGQGGPIITLVSFTNGFLGLPYNGQIEVTGGIPFNSGFPYNAVVQSGSFPPGLTFTNGSSSSSNAFFVLNGTPTNAGTYPVTVVIADSTGAQVTNSFSITISVAATIGVSASPTNGGSVAGGGFFAIGGSNTVSATPANGFLFVNWTSNAVPVSSSNIYSFLLTTNVALVANFTPGFTVSVSASPGADGSAVGNGTYASNSLVAVTATPSNGFNFINWTSNSVPVSSNTTYNFNISTNVTLVANFVRATFTVGLIVNPTNGGTVGGVGTFNSNSVVTVTATNEPGYAFANWTSNSVIVSSTTNYSFTLNTNVTLTANFSLTAQAIAVFQGGVELANNQTNAINFPAVQVTQPGPIVSFTVSNLGGSLLTISNISVPTNYVLVTNAATLTNFPALIPGETNASPTNGVFSVQLVTSNAGTYSGNIVITNDNTNFTFAITGTVGPAAAAISVLDGATIITNDQTNAVNFGSVVLDQPGITKVFTVTNPGLQTLNISNVSVSAGYALTTNAATNVPAGSNTAFSVQLNTTAAGTIAGTVTISNNAPGENPFVFPITGFVASKIIAVAGNLAFGVVPIDSVSNLTMVISNLGSTNLTVTNISFPSGFAVSWSNGIIVAGSNQLVTVTFSPTAAANYGGNITVGSDATSGSGTLPVSGFGGTSNLLLTVITNGLGTVEPILTVKPLILGHKYTLTATAKPGNVFSNWTGTFVTNKDPLTFTMEPGTVIEANFIPNPFLPIKGVYNGLFSATNGQIIEATAGMLKSLTVGTRGTYSGTLLVNGVGHGLSGTFSLGGLATNKITRPATQGGNLTVVLNLATASNATPGVTGTITATNWVSTNLVADLASNVPFSFEYTMIIPPDTNNPLSNSIPQGDGYAVITNHVGAIKITGALADGTAFNESVPASQAGEVPVYASLYGNKGLLIGWINLSPTNAGALSWVHPSERTGLFESNFVSTNSIVLSGWTNLHGPGVLPTNMVVLTYTNGIVTQSNALVFTVSNNFKVGEVSGTLPLSGSLNPKTGQLTLTLGSDGGKHAGSAVILPEGTNGGGFFVTKTNSGAILLKP